MGTFNGPEDTYDDLQVPSGIGFGTVPDIDSADAIAGSSDFTYASGGLRYQGDNVTTRYTEPACESGGGSGRGSGGGVDGGGA